MKNKKSQVIFFGLMLMIVIVILSLSFTPVLKEITDNARNQSSGDMVGMDCSNSSISDFTKAGCIATDLTPFLITGVLLGIAAAVASAKIIFS